MIALLVLLLLVVGGGVAFLVANRSSGTDLTTTIDTCTIEADGTLGATGEVTGGDDTVRVEVEFRDSHGNALVDSGTADVKGSGSWDVDGAAPDDVQGVTCVVTKLSE